MFATQTGEMRSVDAGMWCSKCETVVQCHVDPGHERDMIEEAVRSYYPAYNERPVTCVCAGPNATIVLLSREGALMGLSVSWAMVRRYWSQQDAAGGTA